MLDVGCHLGMFLEVARERGWDVTGVEPSRWSVEQARDAGLDVRHGTLETVHFPDESFDVVTMWDVVEHLPDPLAELKRMHRILRPDGLLALSTMNVDALFPRLAGRRWPWYMQMHLVYFSRRTLHNMLTKAGYRVCRGDVAPACCAAVDPVFRLRKKVYRNKAYRVRDDRCPCGTVHPVMWNEECVEGESRDNADER